MSRVIFRSVIKGTQETKEALYLELHVGLG